MASSATNAPNGGPIKISNLNARASEYGTNGAPSESRKLNTGLTTSTVSLNQKKSKSQGKSSSNQPQKGADSLSYALPKVDIHVSSPKLDSRQQKLKQFR